MSIDPEDNPDEVTRGIADELAEEQRSISIAEFFEKNKQMLGFDSEARALVTAIKEGVDNALDACEEAGVLPDIFVTIEENDDTYTVIIEDNGPGIVKEQIPRIFGELLYGSRFGKRVQSRGQQGIGISAAVLYSQLTSGEPAIITSRTKGGSAQRFKVRINTDKNDPEIISEEEVDWDRTRGTRIELEMEANMRARKQLHRYIKNTAVVNPHARVHLREPGGEFSFERGLDELPEQPEEIKPHPHGIELGNLMKMLKRTSSNSISGFLQSEFTRVGGGTADEMIEEFKDRYFGRYPRWGIDGLDRDVFIENVGDEHGVDGEAAVAFIDEVIDRLGSDVVYTDVEEAVTDISLPGVDEGDSVDAVWSAFTDARLGSVSDAVDAHRSNRMDEDDLDELKSRASDWLEREETNGRLTLADLRSAIDNASDGVEEIGDSRFSEEFREAVVLDMWGEMMRVPDDPPRIKDIRGDRDVARALLAGMRVADVMSPPTDCLSPIQADAIEEGLRKEYDAEFYASTTRDADVYKGDPFVVEAGLAYGGSLEVESQIDLLRFANRVPLVYQQGACVITDGVTDTDWRSYGLDKGGGSLPNGPMVLMVHVASTSIPFTSESKDAIAAVPEIHDEVKLAVQELGRKLRSYVNKRQSREKRREKERVIKSVLPQIAEKVGEVTERDTPSIEGTMARILSKVFVTKSTNGSVVSIKVENHSSKNQAFKVHDFNDSEPSGVNGEVTVVDLDDEYDLIFDVDLKPGESHEVKYEVEGESGGSLTVEGVDDEVVEVRAG